MAAIQLEAKVEERTRDLEAALGRVETMSRHKSQFLANMSHELRTPLNSILGFAELLQDPQFGAVTPKQSRYLGNIHSSGKHLLSLINDLLDLSKVEAGKLELRPDAFPLADALTAALDQFGTQVDAKGVTLSLQMEEAPDMLVANPFRFKQILYNLLSNAVTFTPTGGAITVAAKMVSRSESRVAGAQPETLYLRLQRFRRNRRLGYRHRDQGRRSGAALRRVYSVRRFLRQTATGNRSGARRDQAPGRVAWRGHHRRLARREPRQHLHRHPAAAAAPHPHHPAPRG